MASGEEGRKVRGEGYTAALIFTSYLSLQLLDVRKGIVAVTHNIGVISQNFSRYLQLFAENVAADARNTFFHKPFSLLIKMLCLLLKALFPALLIDRRGR